MSQENVEVVRRFYAFGKTSEGRIEADEVADRLPDSALGEFFDPKLEWFPIREGTLAGHTYTGFDGVRRWAAELAVWDGIHMEPQEFLDLGDQVVTVLRLKGRLHGLEIDEVWSTLSTHGDDGRMVRFESFGTREGALKAAGLRE